MMNYEFKRHDETDLRGFMLQMEKQQAALKELLSGNADRGEVLSYVEGILASGRPCRGIPGSLFWGFDEPDAMPGDCRVDFYYMPTYLNTAFLMQAFRMMPGELESRFPDFGDMLGKAMTASAGRGFAGHGYDRDDFVRGMKIFASVHTKDFIRKHKDLVPEAFAKAYGRAFRSIERDVSEAEEYLKRVENNWENNHLDDYSDIVKEENEGRHRLFVYGSLMKGCYNHTRFLGDADFLGKASIDGFALYDLGRYPGIKPSEEFLAVQGEVYEMDDETYEAICELEGNGSLYQNRTVRARLGNTEDWTPAEVFVYLGDVHEEWKIPGTEQAWKEREGEEKTETDYVWYACYGSNISRDRFMRYISRCRDRRPPAEDRPYEFAHPVFFAGRSVIWDSKGKVFLDRERQGHAFGRIYRITHEQYEDVSRQEGNDYRHKLLLGSIEGLEVVSFTCSAKPERAIPSIRYLNTILEGLKETYPLLRESAAAKELAEGIFSAEEIRVLDCLREAEHGLTNAQIRERTGLGPADEKRITASLVSLGAIRQDRRTASFSPEDDRAVFFTMPEERELIDRVREIAGEAGELESIPADDLLTSPVMEGGRRMYLTTRYERVPANRLLAIRIHGTTCQVCGFNFQQHYGELGKDYIEVHHLKPLSSLDEEVQVDPARDLACLCANCHRMMHRVRDHVMTVEELRREYRS